MSRTQITCHLLYRILKGRYWRITYTFPIILLETSARATTRIDLNHLRDLSITYGLFWGNLNFTLDETDYLRMEGMGKHDARLFVSLIQDDIKLLALMNQAGNIKARIRPFLESSHLFFSQDLYLSNYELTIWKDNIDSVILSDLTLIDKLIARNAQLDFDEPYRSYFSQVMRVILDSPGENQGIAKRNKVFVASEIVRYGQLFDQVESTPLTIEQRQCSSGLFWLPCPRRWQSCIRRQSNDTRCCKSLRWTTQSGVRKACRTCGGIQLLPCRTFG